MLHVRFLGLGMHAGDTIARCDIIVLPYALYYDLYKISTHIFSTASSSYFVVMIIFDRNYFLLGRVGDPLFLLNST